MVESTGELFLKKTMSLNSVEKCDQNRDGKNRDWQWCQIKPVDRWYRDLVVKCLHCGTLRCSTLFVHKNEESKNSLGLPFKAYY